MKTSTKRNLARVLALVLTLALILPLFERLTLREAKAATDEYGIDVEVPSSFDANDGENPYGSGKYNANKKAEAFVLSQTASSSKAATSDFNAAGKSLSGAQFSGAITNTTISGGNSGIRYVNSVAYDPEGSGRDRYAAAVGYKTSGRKLSVKKYDSAGSTVTSAEFSLRRSNHTSDGNEDDWYGELDQWSYSGYFNLTAGDFNGDGKDELAVYVPQRGEPYVLILNGSTLKEISRIKMSDFMGSTDANHSEGYEKDAKSAKSMTIGSLAAADLNRDGNEELVIAGSGSSCSYGNYTAHMGVYQFDAQGAPKKWFEKAYGDEYIGSGYHLSTAAVTCADIDNDGFQEIVIAGYKSGKDELKTIDYNYVWVAGYNPNSNTIVQNQTSPMELKMSAFSKDGMYKDDDMQPLPALTGVRLKGVNNAEYIYLNGLFFVYDVSDVSFTQYAQKPDKTDETDNGINSWIITNTWINSVVAGNFDGNDMGAEQVMYVLGYKQEAVGRYFYRAGVTGYTSVDNADGTKTVDDQEYAYDGFIGYNGSDTWAAYRKTKDDNPYLSIAAVDADKDSQVYEYKSKEYVYSETEVLAVLEASPYFEDLDYDPGETALGKTTGGGSSTSKTKTAKAGAYLEFEANGGIIVAGVTVKAEATFEHDWEWEYEKELDKSYSVSFGNDGDTHKVVIYKTPAVMYTYTVYPGEGEVDADGNAITEPYTMKIGVPEEPHYSILDVDAYNEIADSDKKITESIISSVPGIPSTYHTSSAGEEFENISKTASKISNLTTTSASTSWSAEVTETETNSKSVSNAFDLKVGAAGRVGIRCFAESSLGGGAFGGGGWGHGSSTFTYTSISREGSVTTPPKVSTGSEYSFNCQFGSWQSPLEDGDKVLVLGYIVNNVVCPPSVATNLSLDTVTTHSITISWESGSSVPESYEIYQVFDDGITDDQYSLIGTVDGNENTFTYDGLEPATSYSLCILSVGQRNGKRIVSPYSNVVSGTTLADSAAPTVNSITPERNVLVGDSTTFEVDATPSSGVLSGLTYSWQKQEKGSTKWVTISGMSSDVLSLEDVQKEMDGTNYRCIVSEVHKGVRTYSYSNSGVLNVGKAESEVTITAKNNNSARTEYYGKNKGYPDTTEDQEIPVDVDVDKVITVTVGEESAPYTVYKNTVNSSTLPEVYLNQNDGKYYVLVDRDETAGTADKAIPLSEDKDHFTLEQGTEDEIHFVQSLSASDLSAVGPLASTELTIDGDAVVCSIYEAELTAGEEAVTIYQDPNTAKYYAYVENEGNYVLTDITDQITDEILLKAIYTDGDETATIAGKNYQLYWAEAFQDEAHYFYYEDETNTYYYYVTDGTQMVPEDPDDPENSNEIEVPAYSLKQLGYQYASAELSGSDETTVYKAKPGAAVQETIQILQSTKIPKAGDQVKLEAVVNSSSSRAEAADGEILTFRIYNNDTGSTVNVYGNLSSSKATAYWTPSEAGVYTVTALYGGSGDLLASQGEALYYVLVDENEEDMFILDAEDVIYGEQVTMALYQADTDSETGDIVKGEEIAAASQGISYRITYTDGEGNKKTIETSEAAFIPEYTGSQSIEAIRALAQPKSGEEVLASRTIFVGRRPLIVTAPTKLDISSSSTQKVPTMEDVVVEYSGESSAAILEKDQTQFTKDDLFVVTAVNASNEELTNTTQAGSFTTRVDFTTAQDKQALTEAFQKLYSVVFRDGLYDIATDVKIVNYEAGSNGKLEATYGSDKRYFASGESVPVNTKIILMATPDKDFEVDTWTVTTFDGTALTENTDYKITADGRLVINSLTEDLNISVTFKPSNYKLTFAKDGEGTIDGYYLKNDQLGTHIASPARIPSSQSVRLIAEPAEGQMIKEWIITEGSNTPAVKKNSDGTNYTNTILDITEWNADTTVTVVFAEIAYYNVETTVEGIGISADGCQVGITGLVAEGEQAGKVLNGSTLIFEAQKTENVVVKEWQVYDAASDSYKVVSESADTFTLNDVNTDVKLKLIVMSADNYSLNFKAVDEAGVEMADVITAAWDNNALTSGSSYIAYIPVSFSAEVPEGYQVKSWTLSDKNHTAEEVATGIEALTYDLESMISDTTVVLKLEKKPVITFAIDSEHADVCELTAVCGEATLTSGSTIMKYETTPLTFTIHPKQGYELIGIQVTEGTDVVETITLDPANVLPETYSGRGALATTTDEDGMLETHTFIWNAADGGFTADVDVAFELREIPKSPMTASYKVEMIDRLEDGYHGVLQAAAEYTGVNGDVLHAYDVTGTEVRDTVGELKELNIGSTMTFTAVPDEGYDIASWTVDGVKIRANDTRLSKTTLKNDTLTIPVVEDMDDMEIKVQFVQLGSRLTFGADPEDKGTVTAYSERAQKDLTNGTVIGVDQEVTFTAVPADTYEVTGWTVNGTLVENESETTFTTTVSSEESTEVLAVIERIPFSVKWAAEDGMIAVANETTSEVIEGNEAMVRGGSVLALEAIADPGMKFDHFEITTDETAMDLSALDLTAANVTLPALEADVEVTAVFVPDANCEVVYEANDAAFGTLEAVMNEEAFASGSKACKNDVVKIKAEPAENYKLVGWTVDGEDIESDALSYELTVSKASHKVVANFVIYNAMVEYGVNDENLGTITAVVAADLTEVASGDRVDLGKGLVFTAEPAEGYLVEGWYSDAACTQAIEGTEYEQTEYSIETLEGDVVVYAKMEEIPSYTITLSKSGSGDGSINVTVNGEAIAIEGSSFELKRHDNVVVEAVPADELNYIEGWKCDGGELNSSLKDQSSYELTNVVEDHALEAVFRPVAMSTISFITDEGVAASVVSAGYDDANMTEVAPQNKTILVTTGKNVLFEVTLADGKMIDSWTVETEAGEVYTGSELGYLDHLMLENLGQNVTVSVTTEDLVEVQIPANGDYDESNALTSEAEAVVYNVSDQARMPEVVGVADDHIVQHGEASYVITAADRRYIDSIELNNAAETADDENVLSVEPEVIDDVETGRYIVKVSNIMVPFDFVVNAPVITYTVRIQTPENGTITVTDSDINEILDGDLVEIGTQLTVVAAADYGYRFNCWTEDMEGENQNIIAGANQEETAIITVNSDMTIAAEMIQKFYTLTINQPEHGTIEVLDVEGNALTDGAQLAEGSQISATVTADTYFKFISWTGDSDSTETTIEFTMIEQDIVLGAEIEQEYFELNIVPNSKGTITVTNKAGEVLKTGDMLKVGTVIKCKATPAKYYALVSWAGTITGTTETVKHKVASDVTVAATFKKLDTAGINAGIKAEMTDTSCTIKWGKVYGAEGYDVIAVNCGERFKSGYIVKTVKAGAALQVSFKKINGVSLSKYSCYKVMVKAYKMVNGTKKYIETSFSFHHASSTNKRYTNIKRVTLNKTAAELKVGRQTRIKAALTKQDASKSLLPNAHGLQVKYYSSDVTVAKVTSDGYIQAVAPGTCKVYVVTISGITKVVKVTVK